MKTIELHPSSLTRKLALTGYETIPDKDTPARDITYFDVLKFEPTEKREAHVLIIQLSLADSGHLSHMDVYAENLQVLCQGYGLLPQTGKTLVYYFDKEGDFGTQFGAHKLRVSKRPAKWAWDRDEQDSLPLKKLASAIKVPTYVLAEKLKVFD